jgi:hypothetical protein
VQVQAVQPGKRNRLVRRGWLFYLDKPRVNGDFGLAGDDEVHGTLVAYRRHHLSQKMLRGMSTKIPVQAGTDAPRFGTASSSRRRLCWIRASSQAVSHNILTLPRHRENAEGTIKVVHSVSRPVKIHWCAVRAAPDHLICHARASCMTGS